MKKDLMSRTVITIAGLIASISTTTFAEPAKTGVHGLSLGGNPKYGPDLQFEWVNPNAPKGGKLVLSDIGSFDSMNPFAIKNNPDDYLKTLVFQTLVSHSYAEPFAIYPEITQTMDVPADGMSITYHLNPKAKWSDGKPLTSKDVEFSFKLLTSDKGLPEYRMYYSDVKGATVIDPQTIRFDFKVKNRELPMIMGELYVLPKHIYGAPGRDFVKSFANVKPVGSGPYVVKSYDFGKQITYERNKNWWAAGEAFARGSYNFDLIHRKYYKDPSAALEGFKAGDFDVTFELSSRAWMVEHAGEKWDKNWIRKENWKHGRDQGSQHFSMNLRRPLFQDRLVRKAIAMAFDFDWANETLFYKQYKQSNSYFNNSEFNAQGLPDSKELAFLTPLKDKLPAEVFTEEKKAIGAGLTGKQRLAEALKLLKQAGWELKDGVMQKNGQKLEFTLLLGNDGLQRVADPYAQSLAKIGIKMNIKVEDSANYIKLVEKFQFDMISSVIGQSESPGNEQRDFWHSSTANTSESRNYTGLKDPAIDALVDKLIYVENREDLITATKALDRALWFNYIAVPHWYFDGYRVSYWNRLGIPDQRPPYFGAVEMIVMYGWADAEKAKKLDAALKSGAKL